MCEFRVTLDGVEIMNEVVYALEKHDAVTIRNIIGESKTLPRARIKEVNVLKTSVILETSRARMCTRSIVYEGY